jgi:hypothetical protein
VKKLLLISTVVLLMFGVLAPASAAQNGPPTGFILQDTDAAYVDFYAGDGCFVSVGFVSTDRLKVFGVPGGFHPHSDLEVRLTGTCSAIGYGVVDTLNDPNAGIATLDSAGVNGIVVPLSDNLSFATVTLFWNAIGDIISWSDRAPGMVASHDTRYAPVWGTVTITGGVNLYLTEADAVVGPNPLEGPRITYYDEVNLRP